MSDERVGAVGLGDKVRDRGGVGNDMGSGVSNRGRKLSKELL